MKVFIATFLIALTVGDAYAQDRNRGNRGNRNNGRRMERGNNGARNNGRVNRPNRNVNRPNRTVNRPNRDVNRPNRTRPNRNIGRTNPPPRRVDRRPPPPRRHVRTRPYRPGTRPGTVHPGRRVRRPHARPVRRYYGTRDYHRPYRYSYRPYRSYRHAPIGRRYTSHRRYRTRFDYYNYLRRNHRRHIYLNWVLYPSTRMNGYYFVDNYPYFIYNGYRHRYSYEDNCNYQLVDKYTHQVVRSNYPLSCARGYDACAMDRDNYNSSERENRYFCAETIHGDDYDYSRPTYDYDEYDDYSDDYYDDYNYNSTNRTTCYDYDSTTGICYDND